MKEISYAFNNAPTVEQFEALRNIQQELEDRLPLILDSLCFLTDRPECERARHMINSRLSLVLNTYERPTHSGISKYQISRLARDLLDKYDCSLNHRDIYNMIHDLIYRIDDINLAEHLTNFNNLIEQERQLDEEFLKDLKEFIRKCGPLSYNLYSRYLSYNKTIVIYLNYFLINEETYQYDFFKIIGAFSNALFSAYQQIVSDLANGHRYRINHHEIETRIVVESLASYFEKFAVGGMGQAELMDDIARSWQYYSPYVYPYCGARQINDDINHFKKVFDMSLSDMNNAYHGLIWHVFRNR